MTDKPAGAQAPQLQKFKLPIPVRIGAFDLPKGAEVDLYPDQIARIEATAKRAAEAQAAKIAPAEAK